MGTLNIRLRRIGSELSAAHAFKPAYGYILCVLYYLDSFIVIKLLYYASVFSSPINNAMSFVNLSLLLYNKILILCILYDL